MKRLFSAILPVIISLFYISCSSLTDTDGDLLLGIKNPKPVTGGGSSSTGAGTVLKSISSTDSNGQPLTVNYTYTANKLSGVSYLGHQNFDIKYEGNRISQIVCNTNNITTTSSTTTYNLIYNGNQLTTVNEAQSLTPGYVQKSISTITYSGGKLSKIRRATINDDTPPVELLYITYDLQYIGNNLSKVTTTKGDSSGVIPPVIQVINYSNFDANKNPFNTLPLEFNVATLNTLNTSFGLFGLNANNTGKVIAGADSANYIYTYNKAGFPLTATSGGETITYTYY